MSHVLNPHQLDHGSPAHWGSDPVVDRGSGLPNYYAEKIMDAETITAIGGAVVLILGAFIKIIKELKKIHVLVNSKLQRVLDELARVSSALALETGDEADEANAAAARRAASEHSPLKGKIKL